MCPRKVVRILASFHSPFIRKGESEVWGGERAFIELVKHLERDVQVDVIERSPSALKSALKDKGVRVFEIEAKSQIEWLIKAILLVFRLRRTDYDVFYAYNHALANVLLVYLASRLLKKPFIINVFHIEKYQTRDFMGGYGVSRGLYSFSVRNALSVCLLWNVIYWVIRRADAILSPSNATSDDIVSLGIPKDRVHTIHLGIEHEKPAFKPKDAISKNIDCIYVGRLLPNKGILDILRAWVMVIEKMPKAVLALVNGGMPNNINVFIKEKGLSNNIIFYGHLARHELSEALYKSKVLALPSHTEGFCFTIGMSLLHGVPVVAYDIPVICEVYGFAQSVRLVDEGNIESLSENILRILAAENHSRSDMSLENDCSSLLQRYSWYSTATKTRQMLGSVIAKGH